MVAFLFVLRILAERNSFNACFSAAALAALEVDALGITVELDAFPETFVLDAAVLVYSCETNQFGCPRGECSMHWW